MASSGSDSDSDLPSSHGSPSSPASFPSSHSSYDSSDASDSSNMSFSSSTIGITVGSVAEVRREMGRAPTRVQLQFSLATDSSLADAHELWAMVTADGRGESELLNPDRLSNKEEAYRFVMNKLERLRRWKGKIDRKLIEVMDKLTKLEEVMAAGGPGVPGGYEPRCFDGFPAHLDITQLVDEEDMDDHIETMRTFLLQRSPATPATHDSMTDCLDRETKEQLAMTRFNLEYLELKATGLRLLSDHLKDGIAKLEERFLKQRTDLGAGNAEFLRFVDIPIYPKEAPPEGSKWFYG